MTPAFLAVADEVREALDAGTGVVALESSLIAQGLPVPQNLETALAAEAAVRDAGAVPATVAVEDGRIVVGADRALLERLAGPGPNLAQAVTPVAVVCSGAKSILDLPATLELLETRRVPVIGYGTDELPAFYGLTSGLRLPHRVDGPQQAAAAISAHRSIPGSGGILIVQPPPAELAIDPDEIEGWINEASADAERRGIRAGAVTPHLLAHLARVSGGRSLRANIGLIVANARTAGAIASVLT